ncbi:hypothetical protein [Cystobacter fuscus]|uniref:hypothetical protein n=1 Tax=Cystobacter fuscus TaxID=43 RepID=UPI0037BF2495
MPSRGDQALLPGGPDFSSEDTQAILAPFLSCASPGDFLALQQRVDMPRLVARLDAWSAVRLGSRGPVREEASGPLNRQRTVFLLQSLERYGAANTAVLAHFVLDSCHDDDLKDILLLLARDRRLSELLEQLPSLGPALEARGIKPSALTERDFAWSDLGRGLARAGKDALDIRRDSLRPLLRKGSKVSIQRIRLIYEGGELKPKNVADLDAAVREAESTVPGVEVLFQ